MTTDSRRVVDSLYGGFARADAATITSTLHPDFTGVVSAGMPNGVGGTHAGSGAMLGDCWGIVFR